MRSRCNRRHGVRPLSAAACACVLSLSTVPAFATGPEEKYYSIKLFVNIYNNAGTTVQEVRDAVNRVNEIFKPAMIRLELTDTCIRTNVDTPGGNDDGLDYFEREQVYKDGRTEIAGADGKGKGLKVAFIQNPSQSTPSISAMGSSHDRTIIMRESPAGNEETARDMAHTLGTMLGLSDLFAPDTQDRLMHWYPSQQTDTKLTPDEIAIIKSNAKRYGKEICLSLKKASTPAVRTPEEHGAKTNPAPVTPGGSEKKIDFARMNRLEGEADYLISIQVGGLIPPMTPQRRYDALFDTDNNPATGLTSFGRPGINHQVIVTTTGENSISAILLNLVTFQTTPLAFARVRGYEQFSDPTVMPPAQPTFTPVADHVQIHVPAASLPLSNGDHFDVTFVAFNSTDGVTDQFNMSFDRSFSSRGPQISTQYGKYLPGAGVSFSGSAFMDSVFYRMFIDGAAVGDFESDPTGALFGTISLDTMPPANFYFVSATRVPARARGEPATEDEFASTVLRIVAPPSCAGDADGSGVVNFADIFSTLANFGADYTPGTGEGDADFNSIVNFADVLAILANFGAACE